MTSKDLGMEGHQVIDAAVVGDEIRQSIPKIQWIAKNDIVDYKVMIPKELYVGEEYNTNSLEIAQGFAESFVSTLRPDARVQFVRFGFCRIDNNSSSHTAIMTHR
jgi:glutamyl-tRNA synthetase